MYRRAGRNQIVFAQHLAGMDRREFLSFCHRCCPRLPNSVVIDNLDLAGIALVPHKADPVLVVDPDAVLSAAVGLERLEPVARQRKVAQGARLMNRPELASRHPGNALKLEHWLAIEDRLRVLVAPAFSLGLADEVSDLRRDAF